MTSQPETRIQGLEALLKSAEGETLPPVDRWNPPYCGDIGMEIRADGTWFYQRTPIGRKPLVKLFSRVLRREPDGRHYLVTPVEKVDVLVHDAPFLAVEMERKGSGRDQMLIFRTNVDDIITCDSDHPMRFVQEDATGGLKPYLRVRGRLDALVTRALYFDLVELAEPGPEAGRDEIGIWSASSDQKPTSPTEVGSFGRARSTRSRISSKGEPGPFSTASGALS